jgi:energy-coupling factor transport system permease protein
MLKDITLGQYFPGNTIIHQLDPRVKLLFTIFFIIALFIANSLLTFAVTICVVVVIMGLAHIGPNVILRGLKPLFFILFLSVFLNLFFTADPNGRPLVTFWVLTITDAGVRSAVFMLLRVTLLIAGTFMLTYTTSPIALTDGLEALLSPLSRLHFPVHELTMIMSIALRFIPTLIEETDKIMRAQKARGANFDTGSLPQRAKALLPLLVPLFISALRRANELAVAMECRCYHGKEGRTRMHPLVWTGKDTAALTASATMPFVLILIRTLGF